MPIYCFVVEDSELYTVPAVRVPRLRRGQVVLEHSYEIFDIHRRLLALLLCKVVLLCQLPRDLKKKT